MMGPATNSMRNYESIYFTQEMLVFYTLMHEYFVENVLFIGRALYNFISEETSHFLVSNACLWNTAHPKSVDIRNKRIRTRISY